MIRRPDQGRTSNLHEGLPPIKAISGKIAAIVTWGKKKKSKEMRCQSDECQHRMETQLSHNSHLSGLRKPFLDFHGGSVSGSLPAVQGMQIPPPTKEDSTHCEAAESPLPVLTPHTLERGVPAMKSTCCSY